MHGVCAGNFRVLDRGNSDFALQKKARNFADVYEVNFITVGARNELKIKFCSTAS